jgi:two-component SAPR family response regulator
VLTDINMASMNGFELAEKILELDINVRVCFMSAGEVNHEAIREVFPNTVLGCFIQKPVTTDYLYRRLLAELG